MSILPEGFVRLEELSSDIQFSLRYAGKFNFLGYKANGYHANTTIITKDAAVQLLKIQAEVEKDGFDLVIYDAYRPQKAVNHFIEWSEDLNDIINKEIFYPGLTKEEIFAQGLIARKSSHTRGSTVDLTIIEKGKQVLHEPQIYIKFLNDREILIYDDNTVNMGSSFDFFDSISAFNSQEINANERSNRLYLREQMIKYGFRPTVDEWWHFTLENETFPDTYFDFDIE